MGSLYDHAIACTSPGLLEDKPCSADIINIRESLKKTNVELWWGPADTQLADCLGNRGTCRKSKGRHRGRQHNVLCTGVSMLCMIFCERALYRCEHVVHLIFCCGLHHDT